MGTPALHLIERRPITGDPGLPTPSTKTYRWVPRAPGPGWVDAYPSPRVVLGKYPVFNGMATWIYRKHFVLRYLNSKYLKKRGLSGGCAMPEPTGISHLLWGRPLHGADARHLQCGRRSRGARSGLMLVEHPEIIVRQMTIIIGKMAKGFLTMSEGPGPKGRFRIGCRFQEPEGPCSFRPV